MNKLEEWIDYMEGESDLNMMAKLGLLLEYSRRDREILQNLMRVRKMIELSDPALEIENVVDDPSFLEKLHQKTISKIKKRIGFTDEKRKEKRKSNVEKTEETSSPLE